MRLLRLVLLALLEVDCRLCVLPIAIVLHRHRCSVGHLASLLYLVVVLASWLLADMLVWVGLLLGEGRSPSGTHPRSLCGPYDSCYSWDGCKQGKSTLLVPHLGICTLLEYECVGLLSSVHNCDKLDTSIFVVQ